MLARIVIGGRLFLCDKVYLLYQGHRVDQRDLDSARTFIVPKIVANVDNPTLAWERGLWGTVVHDCIIHVPSTEQNGSSRRKKRDSSQSDAAGPQSGGLQEIEQNKANQFVTAFVSYVWMAAAIDRDARSFAFTSGVEDDFGSVKRVDMLFEEHFEAPIAYRSVMLRALKRCLADRTVHIGKSISRPLRDARKVLKKAQDQTQKRLRYLKLGEIVRPSVIPASPVFSDKPPSEFPREAAAPDIDSDSYILPPNQYEPEPHPWLKMQMHRIESAMKIAPNKLFAKYLADRSVAVFDVYELNKLQAHIMDAAKRSGFSDTDSSLLGWAAIDIEDYLSATREMSIDTCNYYGTFTERVFLPAKESRRQYSLDRTIRYRQSGDGPTLLQPSAPAKEGMAFIIARDPSSYDPLPLRYSEYSDMHRDIEITSDFSWIRSRGIPRDGSICGTEDAETPCDGSLSEKEYQMVQRENETGSDMASGQYRHKTAHNRPSFENKSRNSSVSTLRDDEKDANDDQWIGDVKMQHAPKSPSESLYAERCNLDTDSVMEMILPSRDNLIPGLQIDQSVQAENYNAFEIASDSDEQATSSTPDDIDDSTDHEYSSSDNFQQLNNSQETENSSQNVKNSTQFSETNRVVNHHSSSDARFFPTVQRYQISPQSQAVTSVSVKQLREASTLRNNAENRQYNDSKDETGGRKHKEAAISTQIYDAASLDVEYTINELSEYGTKSGVSIHHDESHQLQNYGAKSQKEGGLEQKPPEQESQTLDSAIADKENNAGYTHNLKNEAIAKNKFDRNISAETSPIKKNIDLNRSNPPDCVDRSVQYDTNTSPENVVNIDIESLAAQTSSQVQFDPKVYQGSEVYIADQFNNAPNESTDELLENIKTTAESKEVITHEQQNIVQNNKSRQIQEFTLHEISELVKTFLVIFMVTRDLELSTSLAIFMLYFAYSLICDMAIQNF